ncbi:hypothetical protein ISU07_05055 [Nocardioides islandensis]|uniref:PKD domain-containing protein n=1 Tax=Nocardioides islandensis TaxID=433663 RepID=A0A930V7U4_9ACTN|nr:hypothetical protein [Nocardioides islandensis]MBF4762484.1 hypothetical protein [Nocardioides islandensis]
MMVSGHVEGISYSLQPMCVETQIAEPSCINQQQCQEPPDTWKFEVYRTSPGHPNEPWGTVCLDVDTAEHFDVITPGRVFKAMKTLDWPTAELVIQPPDGRTLVNLKTNFLTTTTEPTTKTVSLLGHSVDIEATPVGYTWHFGDGTEQSGTDPGAEYPDLRITHVYDKAGVTVAPSVDVTYHGRFRVDGGAWADIPDELTVAGTPVDLQVLTATPHLVG